MIELALEPLTLILILGLLMFILSGQPIAFALMTTGILAIYLFLPRNILGDASRQSWNMLNTSGISAIALYVFMGELILKGDMSDQIYRALDKWVRNLPGGLLHSCVVFCALFAAISGSSIATAATVGTVALPSMKGRGYDLRMIYGAIGGGATLGILIPPSVIMILYGALANVSIARCFFAGMIPGILLALFFMAYIVIRAKRTPSLAPKVQETISWREKFEALGDLIPIVSLAVVILGGIYFGLYTPTEAAAMGCILVIVFLLFLRRMSWSRFLGALTGCLYTASMLYMILAGAGIVAYVVQYMKITDMIVERIVNLNLSPYVVLAFTCLLYYIMGCFICGTTMVVVTVPVIYPVINAIGFDPIWWGVILTLNIEVGLITPPVGMNLFVIQGIDSQGKFEDIALGALPYVALITLMIILLTLFPQIAMWLPNHMM
jgi:C4-dicarboxylate transporter, DctM subunit